MDHPVGANCNHTYPCKRETQGVLSLRQIHRRGEGSVKMEVVIGVVWAPAQECPQPPEAGKDKEQLLSSSLCKECGSANTLILDCWSAEL